MKTLLVEMQEVALEDTDEVLAGFSFGEYEPDDDVYDQADRERDAALPPIDLSNERNIVGWRASQGMTAELRAAVLRRRAEKRTREARLKAAEVRSRPAARRSRWTSRSRAARMRRAAPRSSAASTPAPSPDPEPAPVPERTGIARTRAAGTRIAQVSLCIAVRLSGMVYTVGTNSRIYSIAAVPPGCEPSAGGSHTQPELSAFTLKPFIFRCKRRSARGPPSKPNMYVL